MAFRYLLHKIIPPLSHLPTWFLIIGYPIYWLELYVFKAREGVTSWLAWILFVLVAVMAARYWMRDPKSWRYDLYLFWSSAGLGHRLFWFLALLLAGAVVLIAVLAALQPIHLIQEFDCLQYHYTLPRQHLIVGSFAHIPWAADDLFLLPIDFALAPFWFATILPNKLPQLIFMFGLMGILIRLTRALAPANHPWAPMLVVLAFLGSHGFGIQMGTGMLDLALAYLFLASLDSLRTGQWWLSAVEFTFFFWSKPLMPVQVVLVMLLMVGLYWMARWLQWNRISTFVLVPWSQWGCLFIALSLAIAGPFIFKSIQYAATPLFPLAPGMLGAWAKIKANPQAWDSLGQASNVWMNVTKDSYGHGRGLVAFLKHWWLLAVPERGVNNAFDYPIGLPYLLFLVPFLFYLAKDFYQRKFHWWNVLVIVIWCLWWFGPQQARFLYIPLLILFIVTSARLVKPYQGLLACLVVALALQVVSLWGAHKHDIFRSSLEVLRVEDKHLMSMNQEYLHNHALGYRDWPTHDVAYAQFPVRVTTENLPHTIIF